MNYTKTQINNYQIHIIKTDKFKKTNLKIYFRKPVNNMLEEIKRDILCNLLVLGTNKYKSKRELEIKCEDLFGASFSINNTRLGNYNVMCFGISFLNDSYTLENTTLEAINFIKEIIFNPKIENNMFDQKLFELAKRNYIDDIKSIKDNPDYYSVINMRHLTDKKSLYGENTYFYLNKIEKITNEDLYNEYLDIINNNQVDIGIIGNIDSSIISNFNNLPIKSKKYNDIPYSLISDFKEKENSISDNYNQSKLAISCSLNNLTDFEKLYVARIYSYILGGSSDSLIFKKLRQDNSLCYYANSNYLLFFQMLEINVGLESKNYKLAVKLIKDALEELKNGNFDDNEIKKAQATYENAWKEMLDNPSSIINMYLSNEYYGFELVEERIKKMQKITKEDIINISNKISLNTIYLLKGKDENEQDSIK